MITSPPMKNWNNNTVTIQRTYAMIMKDSLSRYSKKRRNSSMDIENISMMLLT